MIMPEIHVRSALKSDKSALANLIHFETYVHRHLDYRPPLDWIGQEPFLVFSERQRVRAALACPEDPPLVAWIRLFAVDGHVSARLAWDALWEEAKTALQAAKVQHITAIPVFSWFETILRQSSFKTICKIVMLQHDTHSLPENQLRQDVTIRPMTISDLSEVHKIDQQAFSPLWANSLGHLEATLNKALVATVAEVSMQMVGYQISTKTALGCHLARLAVQPGYQNGGVGYALLYDLIRQINQYAGQYISVNTQQDNFISLALYKKAGFNLTGEEYPVYKYQE